MTLRTRLTAALLVVVAPVVAGAIIVGTTPRTDLRSVAALLVGLVVAAVLAAIAAARWLTRTTTRPLRELTDAADRIADGDLTVRVPVRDGDEVGQLAAALNRAALRTQSYLQALTASREQLRGHLAVLGDTLANTHNLERILRTVLRTSLATTGAGSGAVLLLEPATGELVGLHADRGAEPDPIRLPLGAGLLGSVAATGQALRGAVGVGGPELHETEPRCRTYAAMPIAIPAGTLSASAAGVGPGPALPAVRGVLALYDRLGGDEFDDTDLAALRTFAGQAAMAVDNVRAHEEAQRLSLTDPLTGLWNYRYLRESLRREVERASRFRRMLTVLALDLDRFKEVNDAYGHPAGDAVLAELARRMRAQTREVDLAFRQGGEEFVVLLPETGPRGGTVVAQRLRDAVRGSPILVAPRGLGGQLRITITVSIGIAVFPDHARTPQGVLDAADDALYAAKAAGRDTYRVATEPPEPVATSELPVRAGARTPDHDLPQAGKDGTGSGGAQPPRQNRGR